MAQKIMADRVSWLSTVVSRHIGKSPTVVEVGVFRGVYAKELISRLKPALYAGIDTYKFDAQRPPHHLYNTQEQLDGLYESMRKILHPHLLLREDSALGATNFLDNAVDFVYIDADHTYESVKRDIAAWYPKVRSGGIFGGHDYIPRNHKLGIEFGVIQAVDELVAEHNLDLYLTREQYATWWVRKP